MLSILRAAVGYYSLMLTIQISYEQREQYYLANDDPYRMHDNLSGIHASIVGAVMGFLAPITKFSNRVGVSEKVEKLLLLLRRFLSYPS